MPDFISIVSNIVSPYSKIILFIVLIIIFFVIGFLIYNYIISKGIKNTPYKNVANSANRGQIAQIYFFYVDWCPHCKTAKPEWTAFKQEYENKQVNSSDLEFVEVNCTDADNPFVQKLVGTNADLSQAEIGNFNITSYPTVFILLDGTRIDFDSKITKDSLEQFVNSVL